MTEDGSTVRALRSLTSIEAAKDEPDALRRAVASRLQEAVKRLNKGGWSGGMIDDMLIAANGLMLLDNVYRRWEQACLDCGCHIRHRDEVDALFAPPPPVTP